MGMTVSEFNQWWNDQATDEPFFTRLNAHYVPLESSPAGFEHLGSHAFGDIILLRDIPAEGYATLLTKGLSGFHLKTHSDDNDLMRLELAWTLKREFICDETIQALIDVADLLLQRRRGFHQNEVFPYDFSRFEFPNHLSHFMASNGYWFADGLERLDADIPMYMFELFALTSGEADAASRDVESFGKYVERHDIDIEDLRR